MRAVKKGLSLGENLGAVRVWRRAGRSLQGSRGLPALGQRQRARPGRRRRPRVRAAAVRSPQPAQVPRSLAQGCPCPALRPQGSYGRVSSLEEESNQRGEADWKHTIRICLWVVLETGGGGLCQTKK